MELPEVPIGPLVLSEEAPDYGLWAFLQGESYRQRGGGLKYIHRIAAYTHQHMILDDHRRHGCEVLEFFVGDFLSPALLSVFCLE